MRIDISINTVKNLSDLSYGESLLDILKDFGLVIEKVNAYEPVNKPFEPENFPQMWSGKNDCTFLFKGSKEVSFSGMASWVRNLHPDSQIVCGVNIFFNLKKNYDVNKLLQLGDALFIWCDAFYGAITEHAKDPIYTDYQYVNSGRMLYHLFWANYFGKPYMDEPDFNIPADPIKVGNGVRVMLADSPTDEKLSDPAYIQMRKQEIGEEWFWVKPDKILRKELKKKVPFMDRSEITRKEESCGKV